MYSISYNKSKERTWQFTFVWRNTAVLRNNYRVHSPWCNAFHNYGIWAKSPRIL